MMNGESPSGFGLIVAVIVIAASVVGYFVGMQAPMLDRDSDAAFQLSDAVTAGPKPGSADKDPSAIPAISYSEIGGTARSRVAELKTILTDLKQNIDPLREFTISEAEKRFALQLRETNRAFNGAPPTIPHPVEQMTDNSCMACHGEGISTKSMRVSKMSHQFLSNCTQCHVESDSRQFPVTEFRESSFVGLPAPDGGPQAFPGAPQQIPHSTWMRVNCMSCHGFAGAQGIRTTHPWRHNCQQCHAPSSALDQIELETNPGFLPPLQID